MFILLSAVVIIACGYPQTSQLADDSQFKYVNDCARLLQYAEDAQGSKIALSHMGCTYFADGSVDYPVAVPVVARTATLFTDADNLTRGTTCQVKRQGIKIIAYCANFPPITLGWVSSHGHVSLNDRIKLEIIGHTQGQWQVVGADDEHVRQRFARLDIGILPR